jgi:hypothetical protein
MVFLDKNCLRNQYFSKVKNVIDVIVFYKNQNSTKTTKEKTGCRFFVNHANQKYKKNMQNSGRKNVPEG